MAIFFARASQAATRYEVELYSSYPIFASMHLLYLREDTEGNSPAKAKARMRMAGLLVGRKIALRFDSLFFQSMPAQQIRQVLRER